MRESDYVTKLCLMKTVNGGRTWSRPCELPAPGIEYGWDTACRGIAVAPADSSIVYAVGDAGDWDYHVGHVFRSSDAGETWVDVTNNLNDLHIVNPGATYPYENNWYAYAVFVHPSDADRVLVGTQRGVFLSTDGGGHWNATGQHLNVYALAYDESRDVLYSADQSHGVYTSEDGGTSWTELNAGLGSQRCYSIGVDSQNGYLFVGTYGSGVFRMPLATGVSGWELY